MNGWPERKLTYVDLRRGITPVRTAPGVCNKVVASRKIKARARQTKRGRSCCRRTRWRASLATYPGSGPSRCPAGRWSDRGRGRVGSTRRQDCCCWAPSPPSNATCEPTTADLTARPCPLESQLGRPITTASFEVAQNARLQPEAARPGSV